MFKAMYSRYFFDDICRFVDVMSEMRYRHNEPVIVLFLDVEID